MKVLRTIAETLFSPAKIVSTFISVKSRTYLSPSLRIVKEKGGVHMKRWFVIGLLFVCSLGVVMYGVKASDRSFFMPEELGGVKIVIDPGHGGLDGGLHRVMLLNVILR